MLQELVKLGEIEFRSEPLDDLVERRRKAIWAARSYPNCREDTLQALDRGGSPDGGRTRWTGGQGDEVTLVAACRDVLLVVSAAEETDYDDDLAPVIEEVAAFSQPLGEVWTDGLPTY